MTSVSRLVMTESNTEKDPDMIDDYEFPPVQNKIRKAKEVYGETGMGYMEEEKETESQVHKQLPVQYAMGYGGYHAVNKTIKALPPDSYILEKANGIPIFIPQKVVTDELIRLPDSKSDMIIDEFYKFWEVGDRFKKYGFVHKRGYLLWGPPGSGKTATVTFIMKDMVARGGMVILGDTNPNLVSSALAVVRQIEKDRPVVVVLEDIDTIIQQYGEAKVLSLLDGENSIDKVVFLATTNYPEQLDGRIVNRPSRFDRVVKIDTPNEASRRLYFTKRAFDLNADQIETWVAETDGFSIAHLKSLIQGVLCFGRSFEYELKRLKAMNKRKEGRFHESHVGFGTARTYPEDSYE